MATTYKDIIKDIRNDKHDIIKIYPDLSGVMVSISLN